MAGALNQTLTCEGNTHVTTGGDIFRCFIIIIIMVLIIGGNIGCLVVFNSPRTKKQFMKRVRYMMTSLCCTDLSLGLLVCPTTIYPALKHCWPFGVVMCKIEALLISAFFHESTLNMVLIAIDRCCVVHCSGYNKFMTSRKFLCIIVGTWVTVFTCYAVVIFEKDQFYFDEFGINCEPYYLEPKVTLTVLSIFYFVPAIIFAVCYGWIYRTSTQRRFLTLPVDDKHGKMVNANIRTSKYLAAITGSFFLAVSPWTLCTLIIVAEDIKLQEDADFFVTWLAVSNSFLNCLVYGVMNRKFRRAALKFTCGRWVKSLQNSEYKKSQDESRDFTEDTNIVSNNRIRQNTLEGANKIACTVGESRSSTIAANNTPIMTYTETQQEQETLGL